MMMAQFSDGLWGAGIFTLVIGLLMVGGAIWLARQLWKKAETRHREALAGLLDTLSQQYPEEVRLIGGRSVLEDRGRLETVLGVIRKPEPAASTAGSGSPDNLTCPHCRRLLTVPKEYAGQLMKCPLCASTFRVPG
jgi:hypothetical protein